jgi:hypothetical protein
MKIDLCSSDGGPMDLMRIASGAAIQLGRTREEAIEIIRNMMSGDYHNMLNVMDQAFPFVFQFVNDPRRRGAQARARKKGQAQ